MFRWASGVIRIYKAIAIVVDTVAAILNFIHANICSDPHLDIVDINGRSISGLESQARVKHWIRAGHGCFGNHFNYSPACRGLKG